MTCLIYSFFWVQRRSQKVCNGKDEWKSLCWTRLQNANQITSASFCLGANFLPVWPDLLWIRLGLMRAHQQPTFFVSDLWHRSLLSCWVFKGVRLDCKIALFRDVLNRWYFSDFSFNGRYRIKYTQPDILPMLWIYPFLQFCELWG